MGKLLSFISPLALLRRTNTQAAETRKEKIAVLQRLRADQHFAKIRFAEDMSWMKLTDIVCEFIDWRKANAYILCNERAA